MTGKIILVILVLVEIGFAVLSIQKKSNLKKEKAAVRIALFGIFLILALSPVIDWGFRWITTGVLLGVQTIMGIILLVRKKENAASKRSRAIFSCLGRILLIVFVLLPALMFPQYKEIKPTGEYSVGTASYTLTDESREEYFTKEKDNRKVSIQYWYPVKEQGEEEVIAEGKFPLVVFSHGAFGYRMSNYSTFQELASHGYVVCSIDHTYHAFMTKQEDGKTIIADMEFINNAMKAQNGDTGPEETYKLEQEWMKLRTGDMAFVLDYIKGMAASTDADALYRSIDTERIGLFGHSLGGATAAQIGREDEDVDAVIVVDGTMLGEITGFENGKDVITDKPYPKPIMNIYGESHYKDEVLGSREYPNTVAHKNAVDSCQVVIKGSGHINFTDLAVISPFLSNMLGGLGDVDARYCIETMNSDVLQYFDHYLKSSGVSIPKERFQ